MLVASFKVHGRVWKKNQITGTAVPQLRAVLELGAMSRKPSWNENGRAVVDSIHTEISDRDHTLQLKMLDKGPTETKEVIRLRERTRTQVFEMFAPIAKM